MILGFTIALVAIACAAGLLDTVLGFVGLRPNDLTLGAVVLVEVLVVAQIVISIVAPLVGNPPSGSLPEFWVYLVTAAIIPPLAVLWALLERTRWATVVLGVAAFAIAVMEWRMHQIWTVQLA